MNLHASVIHQHIPRSGPRGAKGDAGSPSSPRIGDARRWSVTVTHRFASRDGFAISRKAV